MHLNLLKGKAGMKTIISIVGTSLLTNKLKEYIHNGNPFPQRFIDCLDPAGWSSLSDSEKKDTSRVVELIKPDAEEKLKAFLQLPVRVNLVEASAETTSLKLFINELISARSGSLNEVLKQLKLYFIASNTIVCRACAHALAKFYRDKMRLAVEEPIVIQELTDEAGTFEQGISRMTDRLIQLIRQEKDSGNDVFLNATGGFKPESTYATICGLLNQVEVIYAHEHFREQLARLPSLPVGFDFTPWHLNAFKIECALSGHKAAYDSLPGEIKDLMSWDAKRGDGSFNQVGHLFWESYRHTYRKHRLSPQMGFLADMVKDTHLKGKILKFIDGWDHLWVGMQIPQMIDHGRTHCQNMLMRAEELLLPMKFLTEEEIYLLIACIWLHDIGHTEPIEIKKDGTEEPLSPREIRDKHHSLAYQLIERYPREFGFPQFNDEARVIAEICKDHRSSNLEEVPETCHLTIYDDEGTTILRNVQIRRRLITALLQFIDTCDLGGPRAGSEDYIRARLNVTEREIRNLRKRKEVAQNRGEEEFVSFLTDELEMIESCQSHFNIHQKIARVEIKPEKSDNGWKVKMIIYPREGVSDIIKIITGQPMKVTKDINRIKAFLRPHVTDVTIEKGLAISWEG
jgi:putative CRISPR-associated protein (TIGR02619 family)